MFACIFGAPNPIAVPRIFSYFRRQSVDSGARPCPLNTVMVVSRLFVKQLKTVSIHFYFPFEHRSSSRHINNTPDYIEMNETFTG